MSGYAVVDIDDEPRLEFKSFSTSTEAPHEAPYNPFNIAYYQCYFDVDTTTVLQRVGLAMIPREGFIAETCDGQIDLYGPFWTLTTLILALYTTSTLTASITQYLASAPSTSNLPLLSTATTIVYVYGLVVPAMLWASTTWLGVGDWRVSEALGIYGYAMSVFVPISLLCLIPVGILRWALVLLGAISSGYFIFRNIYPILASSDKARYLIVAVVVAHAGMALAMKVLFFSYSVGGLNIGPDPVS